MHSVSDLYREILEQPDHYKEIRVVIGGVEQTVINCSMSAAVNSSAAVGGTSSRQLSLDILPRSTISENDPVTLFVRLSSRDNTQKSEWIPKGTYLMDTASMDTETGVMFIHAFDAIMKMEQPFLSDADYEHPENWPKSPSEVMDRIADAIGVTIDPRSRLNNSFAVPFPTENSNRGQNSDSETSGPPYMLNTSTKVIHCLTCRRVDTIAPESLEQSNSSVAALEADGYRICRICRPSDGDAQPEPDTSASLSMRTVAGYIAAMNCGNWVITDENRLYLLPFEIFDSSLNLLAVISGGNAVLFGNTVILV